MSRIEDLRAGLGGVNPSAVERVKDRLEPLAQAFIEHAPFAVMASSNADGDCDASPKGGKPGWIKVVDERTLLIPDVGGTRLFQSFENFESNPKAGFVFMIPGMETTVRVNGRVQILEGDEASRHGVQAAVHNPDDNAGLVQGLMLHVDEAYFHCQRALQFADLWNTETIAANRGRPMESLAE